MRNYCDTNADHNTTRLQLVDRGIVINTALSRAEPTQFLVLIPIYLSSILMLSSHLRLGLLKGMLIIILPVCKS